MPIRLSSWRALVEPQVALPTLLVGTALALAGSFELGARPPVFISIAVFVFSLLSVGLFLRTQRFPMLSFYVLALYSLPFINLIDHVLHAPEYFARQEFIWGLAANDYQRDPIIIEATGAVGAIGAASLAAGMFMAAALLRRTTEIPATRLKLALPSGLLLLGSAVILAWSRAPSATIFEVAYTKGVSPLESCGLTFNAPIMVASILIGATVVDLLAERGRSLLLKSLFVTGAVVLVVFWFGFLHGLRESISIVPAIAVLGTFAARFTRALRRPLVWLGLVALAGAVVVTGQVIGNVRSDVAAASGPRVETCPATALIDVLNFYVPSAHLSSPSPVVVTDPAVASGLPTPTPLTAVVPSSIATAAPAAANPLERLLSKGLSLGTGTWSAVLLSPLSVVGDAERGLLTPRLGATYVDYILSLPPSFVAQTLHYERPIEPTRGPAWEVRYGIGGTHLLVVPFENFRTPGVVFILALFGVMVAATEIAARRRPSWPRLLWFATVLIVAPRWLWYGDLYMVRGAMAFAAVLLLVWLLPKAVTGALRLRAVGRLSDR